MAMNKRDILRTLAAAAEKDPALASTLAALTGLDASRVGTVLRPKGAAQKVEHARPAALVKALAAHAAALGKVGAAVPEGFELSLTADGVTYRRRAGRPKAQAAPAPVVSKAPKAPKSRKAS
jgi:hypothetical protein